MKIERPKNEKPEIDKSLVKVQNNKSIMNNSFNRIILLLNF